MWRPNDQLTGICVVENQQNKKHLEGFHLNCFRRKFCQYDEKSQVSIDQTPV